jgi:hypothetical protein
MDHIHLVGDLIVKVFGGIQGNTICKIARKTIGHQKGNLVAKFVKAFAQPPNYAFRPSIF